MHNFIVSLEIYSTSYIFPAIINADSYKGDYVILLFPYCIIVYTLELILSQLCGLR